MTTTTMRTQGPGSCSASGTSGSTEASTPLTLEQLTPEHSLSYDPRFISATTDLRYGYSLADRVYDLSEPWRSRFVDLIVQRVGSNSMCGGEPSRTQLAVWLSDQQLSRMIRTMLRTWTHEN